MTESNREVELKRTYYPSGQLACEEPYVGEMICGVIRCWHENGAVMSETPMVDSVPHGMARKWNRDGKIVEECNYVMGAGVFRTWYDDGRLESEMAVKNGGPHGRQRCWDEEGTLIVEYYYILGRRVSKKKYREACTNDPSLPVYDFDEPVRPWAETARETPVEGGVITEAEYEDARDALEWLRESSDDHVHILGELSSKEESVKLAEEFLASGATRVLAVEIETDDDGSQNTSQLVIELPAKRTMRKAALKFCNEQNQMAGFSPVKDTGQQFVHVRLD